MKILQKNIKNSQIALNPPSDQIHAQIIHSKLQPEGGLNAEEAHSSIKRNKDSPDSATRLGFYNNFLNQKMNADSFMAKRKRNRSQEKTAPTQISTTGFHSSTENQDALPTIADSNVQHGRAQQLSMLSQANQERDLSIPEIESS